MTGNSRQKSASEHGAGEYARERAKAVPVTLRDFVMQRPPTPPARVLPLEATRRAACTHVTMTRLFGVYRCYVCHRVPELGWVYTCTQDHDHAIHLDPGINNTAKEMEYDAGLQEKIDGTMDQLSGWIVKAIKDGQYTAEQVEVLKAQKRKVKETITALEDSLRVSKHEATTKNQLDTSTTFSSTDSSSALPFPVITGTRDGQATQQTPEVAEQPRAKLFPDCQWKCCHACRPTYQDRAWQGLDGVLAGDATPFVIEEFGRYRVSDANIARKLGLTRPPIFDSFENMEVASTEGEESHFSDLDLHRVNELDEDREEDSSSKGFRASVKRAFRGMLMSRQLEGLSTQISAKSRRKSSRSEGYAQEFDIGLWRIMNDELLHIAANTRLPGHDGMDGLEFETGEVEVEGGVAVTEEAVDLGTADIIMSV